MSDTEKNQQANKKTLKIVGIVILAIIFVIVIAGISSGGDKVKNTDNNVVAAKKSDTSKQSLAVRVDKMLKKNLDTDSYTDAGEPFTYVNGMKDQGSGWVDVNYQTDCDKDRATFVAKQIMGTVGSDLKDLKTVNVICTNGTSSYAGRDGMFTD